MNPLSQAIISGLMAGAVYALLATGLVIVQRTSGVLNLAHGETFAVSGVVAALLAAAGTPAWLYLVAGVAAATVYSIALDRVLLRPRRHWPVSALILVTLAAAFLTRGVLRVVAGADPQSFPSLFVGPPLRVLGGIVPLQALALIVVGFAAAGAATVFLIFTETGRRLRATAENPDAAELMGIDVDRMRVLAFGIAGFLGGLSAILLVPLVSVDFQAGLAMTLRGFIAAALAGMSPNLAIFGGLVLGLAEALVTMQFGALAQDPVVFLFLIGGAAWQARRVRFGGSVRA